MTPIQMEVAEALRDSDAGNEERDAVVAIIERRSAEAAARAVDEALSVERMSVEIDRHWLMDTPRGVGCTCQGWSLLLSEVPDEAGLGEHLLPFSAHIAAALAAHLRGPRPEGEG